MLHRLSWLLMALCLGLLLPGRVQAQRVDRAQRVDEVLLSADEPVGVFINDNYISLAISTGTVDHVTLNDAAVQTLGLVAAPRDNIANLMIGGVVALNGRHGPA